MRCPYCGSTDDKVVDSRSTRDGGAVRRRRECLDCGRRFTTYEKIEGSVLMVVKRDGSREAFDRSKILTGILKACEKRPVSGEAIEQMVDSIEAELHNKWEKEVKSTEIGEMVMQRLHDMDEVAYVRFASVYRQFRDITDFMQEIKGLLK